MDWFRKLENRRVAFTDLGARGKLYTTFVSTMALWGDRPEWETMWERPGPGELRQFWRWRSLQAAQEGHTTVLKLILTTEDPGEGI